jgi:hypothetical protein
MIKAQYTHVWKKRNETLHFVQLIYVKNRLGMLAHMCNSSYVGIGDGRIAVPG